MTNKPFKNHTGIAAPLLSDNIDTDQIIPSKEMKTVSKTGLSSGLFAGQRYIEDLTPNPEFILNKQGFNKATILLSGKNFGCGSSREHAVWALKDYGFRAIIAESFGAQNLTIDLEAQTVENISFEINSSDKKILLGGLDTIALTLEHEADIQAFHAADKNKRPWIYN